jgi:ribose 5-phosphate isomerase A
MPPQETSKDQMKQAVGYKAAELVQNGMLVGLGTGSTAHYFIQRLIQRCQEGLKITAVSSSERSAEMARTGGITILEADVFIKIDLTVDGADEINPQKYMIKGGGGALLREKIVATSSTEMVVIVDESKLVRQLGAFGLPVEIVRFGYRATISKLLQAGYQGVLRQAQDGSPYVTDNGNYIFDVRTPTLGAIPEDDENKIKNIAGVVETGFFIHIAGRVIVGFNNGTVEIYKSLPPTLPYR